MEVEVWPAAASAYSPKGGRALDDPSHLAARVAIDVAGHDHLAITVHSEIPMARGLGASAALATAATAAAGAKDPLAVAAQVEGHSGDAAASVVSRLIAASHGAGGAGPFGWRSMSAWCSGHRARSGPGHHQARHLLPTEWSVESPPSTFVRLALLIAGLADGRVLIFKATEDRLHQDYRSPLFPAAPQVLSGLSRAGAWQCAQSGAGPALLGICKGSEDAAVQAANQEVMAETT